MPAWCSAVALALVLFVVVLFVVILTPRERRGRVLTTIGTVALALPLLMQIERPLLIVLAAVVVGTVVGAVEMVAAALLGPTVNAWVAARCGTWHGDLLAELGLGGEPFVSASARRRVQR